MSTKSIKLGEKVAHFYQVLLSWFRNEALQMSIFLVEHHAFSSSAFFSVRSNFEAAFVLCFPFIMEPSPINLPETGSLYGFSTQDFIGHDMYGRCFIVYSTHQEDFDGRKTSFITKVWLKWRCRSFKFISVKPKLVTVHTFLPSACHLSNVNL